MNASLYPHRRPTRAKLAAVALVALGSLWSWTPASASTPKLPPQTNIRVTIVQWMSTKGVYEKWDALGGDFEVSDDGTLSLPIIGTFPVGDLDETQLSVEIARRLKERIGLVETPEATVAILSYPPIYIVGDVKSPGEYKFHTGLTVLQALAMGGGEFRGEGGSKGASDKTSLVGILLGTNNSILRSQIRIARLEAEMAGARKISFTLPAGKDWALAAAILKQEQAIFVTRAGLLERQTAAYKDLQELLNAEIDNLKKKAVGADADIASVEKELRNVKSMVDKGIALPSKLGDLERLLRSYYAGRLDLTTAEMRARQNITEALRSLEGLHDQQSTDVASELQSEQAALEQLQVKRDTTQQQLLDALSESAQTETPGDATTLTFTVDRRVDGKIEQIAAAEDTTLQPGDVVRVKRSVSVLSDPSSAASVAKKDLRAEISQ